MTYEIDFKSPCPVYKCYKAKRFDEIYWIDSNYKHHYKLTRFGKLKCIRYNCYNNSESDLLTAKFKYEYHEREKGSYQAFLNTLQIASQINFDDNQKKLMLFVNLWLMLYKVKEKNIKYKNNFLFFCISKN